MDHQLNGFHDRGAIFSACGQYRYALWRVWATNTKPLMVIGLNPSTADAHKDDPTIRRCVGYAASWGYGGLLMGNLFAFRSTFPVNLVSAPDPIGPDNDEWLSRMKEAAGMVLAAWGNSGKFKPERATAVIAMFPTLHHLGVTQEGQPRHPVRLAKSLTPIVFSH